MNCSKGKTNTDCLPKKDQIPDGSQGRDPTGAPSQRTWGGAKLVSMSVFQ